MEYEDCNGVPVPRRVHTIVISTQHAPEASNDQLRADLMEHVIKSVVPPQYLDQDTVYHLNPSGKFVIGGPHGDAGLTGRKIIIDTYGGKSPCDLLSSVCQFSVSSRVVPWHIS